MNLLPSIDQLKSLPAGDVRRRAGDFVRAKGLPTKRDDDWRYTSLKPLGETDFASALARPVAPSHETLKTVAAGLGDWAHNFVFINGVLDRTLSSLEDLPDELSWSNDVSAADFADAVEALNVANLGQGLVLAIKAGHELAKPVRIHFHTAAEGGAPLMTNPRVQIDVGALAVATVVESYSGDRDASYFVNAHSEIMTGVAAKVTYVRVQDDGARAFHIGRTRLSPDAETELTSLIVSVGARTSRHGLEMTLKGTAVNAKILGAVAAQGTQHADNMTEIDHRVGGCTTRQVYKSLLDGESRSVFTGRIRIRPGAQKADSDQMNNNLLLSSKAEADSRPQLMIEADDVKATHGSTAGELSDEEIFYLMSRGVSRDRAISLLAAGFLAELAHEVADAPTRAWLLSRLARATETMKPEAAK